MQNNAHGDLVEMISQCREPWECLAREWKGQDSSGQLEGLYEHIQQINGLIPPAETLQAQNVVDFLYPMVHHAVIALKRQRHSVRQQEAFMIVALAEGQF